MDSFTPPPIQDLPPKPDLKDPNLKPKSIMSTQKVQLLNISKNQTPALAKEETKHKTINSFPFSNYSDASRQNSNLVQGFEQIPQMIGLEEARNQLIIEEVDQRRQSQGLRMSQQLSNLPKNASISRKGNTNPVGENILSFNSSAPNSRVTHTQVYRSRDQPRIQLGGTGEIGSQVDDDKNSVSSLVQMPNQQTRPQLQNPTNTSTQLGSGINAELNQGETMLETHCLEDEEKDNNSRQPRVRIIQQQAISKKDLQKTRIQLQKKRVSWKANNSNTETQRLLASGMNKPSISSKDSYHACDTSQLSNVYMQRTSQDHPRQVAASLNKNKQLLTSSYQNQHPKAQSQLEIYQNAARENENSQRSLIHRLACSGVRLDEGSMNILNNSQLERVKFYQTQVFNKQKVAVQKQEQDKQQKSGQVGRSVKADSIASSIDMKLNLTGQFKIGPKDNDNFLPYDFYPARANKMAIQSSSRMSLNYPSQNSLGSNSLRQFCANGTISKPTYEMKNKIKKVSQERISVDEKKESESKAKGMIEVIAKSNQVKTRTLTTLTTISGQKDNYLRVKNPKINSKINQQAQSQLKNSVIQRIEQQDGWVVDRENTTMEKRLDSKYQYNNYSDVPPENQQQLPLLSDKFSESGPININIDNCMDPSNMQLFDSNQNEQIKAGVSDYKANLDSGVSLKPLYPQGKINFYNKTGYSQSPINNNQDSRLSNQKKQNESHKQFKGTGVQLDSNQLALIKKLQEMQNGQKMDYKSKVNNNNIKSIREKEDYKRTAEYQQMGNNLIKMNGQPQQNWNGKTNQVRTQIGQGVESSNIGSKQEMSMQIQKKVKSGRRLSSQTNADQRGLTGKFIQNTESIAKISLRNTNLSSELTNIQIGNKPNFLFTEQNGTCYLESLYTQAEQEKSKGTKRIRPTQNNLPRSSSRQTNKGNVKQIVQFNPSQVAITREQITGSQLHPQTYKAVTGVDPQSDESYGKNIQLFEWQQMATSLGKNLKNSVIKQKNQGTNSQSDLNGGVQGVEDQQSEERKESGFGNEERQRQELIQTSEAEVQMTKVKKSTFYSTGKQLIHQLVSLKNIKSDPNTNHNSQINFPQTDIHIKVDQTQQLQPKLAQIGVLSAFSGNSKDSIVRAPQTTGNLKKIQLMQKIQQKQPKISSTTKNSTGKRGVTRKNFNQLSQAIAKASKSPSDKMNKQLVNRLIGIIQANQNLNNTNVQQVNGEVKVQKIPGKKVVSQKRQQNETVKIGQIKKGGTKEGEISDFNKKQTGQQINQHAFSNQRLVRGNQGSQRNLSDAYQRVGSAASIQSKLSSTNPEQKKIGLSNRLGGKGNKVRMGRPDSAHSIQNIYEETDGEAGRKKIQNLMNRYQAIQIGNQNDARLSVTQPNVFDLQILNIGQSKPFSLPFSHEITRKNQNLQENLKNLNINLALTQGIQINKNEVPQSELPNNVDIQSIATTNNLNRRINHSKNPSYNKNSLLGTLKGGIGIMRNISNDHQEDKNEALLNGGHFLREQFNDSQLLYLAAQDLKNSDYIYTNQPLAFNEEIKEGKIDIRRKGLFINHRKKSSEEDKIEFDLDHTCLSKSCADHEDIINIQRLESRQFYQVQRIVHDSTLNALVKHARTSNQSSPFDDKPPEINTFQKIKGGNQIYHFRRRSTIVTHQPVDYSSQTIPTSNTQPIPKEVIQKVINDEVYQESRNNNGGLEKSTQNHANARTQQTQNINDSNPQRDIPPVDQIQQKNQLCIEIPVSTEENESQMIDSKMSSDQSLAQVDGTGATQTTNGRIPRQRNEESQENGVDPNEDLIESQLRKTGDIDQEIRELINQAYNDAPTRPNLKIDNNVEDLPIVDLRKRGENINQFKDDLEARINQQFSKNYSTSLMNMILSDTHHSQPEDQSQQQNGEQDSSSSNSEKRVFNYKFGKQIGEGAYAIVREAVSREDGQTYAVKIYDKTKLQDLNRQKSVRREVILLQKMNHPNIVKLVEAFETDSHVYLVMEHVGGGSLHSYLKQMINKQLDEEEARRIFHQLLVAIKYCHTKCISHRDIKLENVLLDANQNVKLIDFGFATCIPIHKKIRMFCGTPSYMSPQIVSQIEFAGPPADIWATGVLLFALLNGCFPFRGQTDDDLYRRIKRGTYIIQNQTVSKEYLDILQRCLDVNEDTRPSATDLLEDPWFKAQNLKQKAINEEKRQFKARILAKVPLIKKTNQTICILAQSPDQNGVKQTQDRAKGDVEQNYQQSDLPTVNNSNLQKIQGLGSQPQQNMDEIIISDYGLQAGIPRKDINFDKKQQIEVENRPYFSKNQISPQLDGRINLPASSVIGGQLMGVNMEQPDQYGNMGRGGKAIVLSYGAALAPQIQINNISNLNLLNSSIKSKLNQEAYHAYYKQFL